MPDERVTVADCWDTAGGGTSLFDADLYRLLLRQHVYGHPLEVEGLPWVDGPALAVSRG